MRWRIIAYGLAVLVILTGVSLATFWVMSPAVGSRRGGPEVSDAFARAVASADLPTRQRLLDQARERGIALSMYASDRSLLASNVQPPVPLAPEPRQPELDPDDMPPPVPGQGRLLRRFGVDGPAPTHAGAPSSAPIRTRPDMFLMVERGRARPNSFVVGDVQIVMGPTEGSSPLVRVAIILLVTMVGLVLLSFPVTAAMTRKLKALAETAHRLGEGDLSQRADASGSDEVSQTARAFNTMAERIGELRLRERELLANVSHELRTPMARMAVLLELTESKPAEAARYVGELARDLRELESLLDNIIETLRLDLASPRARAPWPMQRVTVDLRDVLAEIADDFRDRAPEYPLAVELGATTVLRDVDRTLIRRAVMNLLDNARKYSPAGAQIQLALAPSGDILVTDRGRGVAAADLPHIFEPFFRAEPSRSHATGGVGLGLTFVKLVAILHNGSVSVDSQLGAGSTFRLALGPPPPKPTHSDTFGTHP